MGYRSEVKAIFYAPKEKCAALKLYMDENFPKTGDLIPDEDLTWFDRNGRCGYMFEADNVKWYPNYAEVIAFNVFVRAFLDIAEGENAEELRWAYEFVRVGEEHDDIETTYAGDCNYVMSVKRTIETNF